ANRPAPVARRGAVPEGIGTMGIVSGTRGSALARAQARIVADRLDGPVELRVIRTAGDATAAPLSALGDGVFVDAIERALANGEVDVAVHSLKDLPTAEREDLVIAAIPEREDPRDVLTLAQCPPAPGQGALAVQCRRGDAALATTLARLDHAPTRRAVTAERALLRALGASCALALGAHARVAGGEIVLEAALATDD